MEREIEVRMIPVDKIRPNPFQPRESFPKEEIRELANTIKEVGVLQPISVRKKGNTYQIISGERRWRAAQFAGLKRLPTIIKDVTDSQLMMESLIENVHRKDLEPLERARGLAEVYRLGGFEPSRVALQLSMIEDVIMGRVKRELSKEERGVKEIADMVALSYDYQYRLLSQLKLTPEEQKRVSKLKLGYEEIATIATIEKPEVRRKIIEIAPELRRTEIKKISKIVKKAPEPVVKTVLERKVRPEVAEVVLELPEEKQVETIREAERLRLDVEETKALVEQVKIEVPVPPPEKWEEIRERYEKLQHEISERLKEPEVKARGKLFRNWLAHTTIQGALSFAFCPICGAEADSRNLMWTCHKPPLNVKDAIEKAREIYQESVKKGEK